MSYALKGRIELEGPRLDGEVEIKATITAPGDSVLFDQKGLDLEDVRVDGAVTSITRAPGGVVVKLPHLANAGETTVFSFRYRAGTSKGLVLGEQGAYTLFDTRTWMPCHFDPADKATFAVTLEVPDGWTAVGAGVEKGPNTFAVEMPHPAYTLGFAAGPFRNHRAQVGKVSIEAHAAGRADADLQHLIDAAGPAFPFFEEKAGRAYPIARYAEVLAPFEAAQELAGMAVLPEPWMGSLVRDPSEDSVVVHEIAHQWWGNAVTCARWNDFWMHEAFANFMAAAYDEQRWGKAVYQRRIDGATKAYQGLKTHGLDAPLAPKGNVGIEQVAGPLLYTKGPIVLSTIRTRIGDDAFWTAVRAFTSDHYGKTATTDDLEKAFEASSKTDLSAFFRDAVYGAQPNW